VGDWYGAKLFVDVVMGAALLIRKIISNLYNRELADNMAVLYGGSVNSKIQRRTLKRPVLMDCWLAELR